MSGKKKDRHTFSVLRRRGRVPKAVLKAAVSALRGWEESATEDMPRWSYWTADEEVVDRFHWRMRRRLRLHRRGNRPVNVEVWSIHPRKGRFEPGSIFDEELEFYLTEIASDVPRDGLPPERRGAHPMVETVLASGRTVYLASFLDRVGQYAWMSAVGPLAEKRLGRHLHSYRPARGVQTALVDVRNIVRQGNFWAVKIDIEDFFGSIRPRHVEMALKGLMPELSWKLIRLAQAWQWATIVRPPWNRNRRAGEPMFERPTAGFLRQGNPIAPMLSNIVGAFFIDRNADLLFDGRGQLVRYGDDMLLLSESLERLVAVLGALKERLSQFGFQLKKSKTVGPIDMRRESMDFLGMTFRGGQIHMPDMRVVTELASFAELPNGSPLLQGALTRVAADLRLVKRVNAQPLLAGLAAQNQARADMLARMLTGGGVLVANDEDYFLPEAEAE